MSCFAILTPWGPRAQRSTAHGNDERWPPLAVDEKPQRTPIASSSSETLLGCSGSGSVSSRKDDGMAQRKERGVGGALDTTQHLAALRTLMDEEGVDAYVVPSEDAHASEYTAAPDQRRTFISGFTGSAGTAIITADSAHLFTDGRYYIQAGKQLDSNWTLHKVPLDNDWDAFLVQTAADHGDGYTVGLDPTLISYTDASQLLEQLTAVSAGLFFPTRNLVDVVWSSDRPEPADNPIRVHPLEFAGKPAPEKLLDVAKWLEAGGDKAQKTKLPQGSAIVLNALDQIAWLLNLRGASIPCNPVFPAYLVIRADQETGYKASLFVPDRLLSASGQAHRHLVEDLHVRVHPYDFIWQYLINGYWQGHGDAPRLVCDEKATWAMVNAVGAPNAHILPTAAFPIALWKAVKNDVEIQGMRNAYLRDGVCWVRWAAWLDEVVRVNKKEIDEYAAVRQLIELRERTPFYGGMEAYDGISASGENAALPHYETPEVGSRIIDRKTPYLCDSGGQYLDGTIDTTRTVHFGTPTAEHKRAFTRVLQGHIAIETSVFPRDTTTGATLDVRGRAPLWQDGCNYMHGTGHGIGSFLNVHEGPQGFSTSSGGSRVPVVLQPNMCLSNEPGFYEEGAYGIRTESIVIVRPVKTRRGFGGADKWLGFERLTVVPIDTRLVDWKLLTPDEARWLKEHNRWCRTKLLPLLHGDKRAQRWVKRH